MLKNLLKLCFFIIYFLYFLRIVVMNLCYLKNIKNLDLIILIQEGNKRLSGISKIT